jgi:hypothetical protein
MTAEQSRMTLPIELPLEFDFEMTTKGLSNRNAPLIGFAIPGGGHFAIGFNDNPQFGDQATLYGVKGADSLAAPFESGAKELATDLTVPTTVDVSVRSLDDTIVITARRNKKEILKWQGDRASLNQSNSWWLGPHPAQPWISQYGGPLNIDSMVVAAVNGRVRRLIPEVIDERPQRQLRTLDLRGKEVDDSGLAEKLKGTSLGNLILEGPGITDASISKIAALPFLNQLALHGTNISEQGIARLVTSTSLTRITFWSMPQIRADVTKHLAKMPLLRHVVLKHCGFHGPGLERLQKGSVRQLNLGNHRFDGQMLRQYILPFGELGVLDLAGSRIRDADVADIKQIQGITRLHLGFNPEIKGPGLSHLKEITTLQFLNLDMSGVSDDGLQFLVGADQIQTLELDGLPITDHAIETLLQLKGLRRLDVTGTEITADGVMRLRKGFPSGQVVTGTSPKTVLP